MGNAHSRTSALATPSLNHSTSASSADRKSFSVTPFEPSTLVSITRAPSSSHSSRGSSVTRTEEHCTWDWEEETSSCSSWVLTVDGVSTPSTTPTLTGGYETSTTSFSFPYYTCTDFLCINSVVSDYGYALCLATTTSSDLAFPTTTHSWLSPTETTTERWPTITPTCDPLIDWEDCPTSSSETFSDLSTVAWPTSTRATDLWPTETSSDCDTSATSSSRTVDFTIPEGLSTRSSTTSKESYTYTSSSSSTRRTRTPTASACDFLFDDCITTVTGRYSSQEWDPTPRLGRTAATTAHIPRHSNDARK